MCVFGAGLFAGVMQAQQQPPGRVLQIPPGRGVYVEAPSGVVNVPAAVILPFYRTGVRELLSIGHSKARVEVDGAGAALEIPNAKPTFYMRGYRPGTRLYLVRATPRSDYRLVRMSYTRNFSEWNRFDKNDLRELHMEPVADDLVSVTPRTDLDPGEYLIVSTLEREFRGIRLAYEFSVVSNRAN